MAAAKPRVAVVLSGCGVYDGAEISESVLTLLALDQQGAEYRCLAPDIEQRHVIDHLGGEEQPGERRNVRREAARIARGEVDDLARAEPAQFQALIVPGGYGAAKNLCDYALSGAGHTVQEDFLRFARALHRAGAPIGLICIAPVMSAAICGTGVQCTVGNDPQTAGHIREMGAEHVECPVDEMRVDRERKLVTTPAYMLAQSVDEAYRGISALVKEVLALI